VTHPQVRPDPAFGLLELYDDALPHVYGYLLARCGDTGLAEDLTAESFLAAVHAVRQPGAAEPSIPWLIGAREVLDRLGAHHRAALTLRYLDGLPVPDVARHLDRTLHATEALLVRARAAFRQIYEEKEGS
jgi:RNA polymerase sigma-70 factor (ECF subfamily)